VYALVLAHNLIPHHHHYEFQQISLQFEYEHAEEHSSEHLLHSHDTDNLNENSCLHEHQHQHSHTFCDFNEKIIRLKNIGLSDLFLPSIQIEYLTPAEKQQLFVDSHLSFLKHAPHCRDVSKRGPPQFS
jgi:hypothetical protein